MAQERGEIDGLDQTNGLAGGTSEELDRGRQGVAKAAAAADDYDRPENAEQIKGEIEETRNQMGETIDAIQEKLSFANISDQVSEHVSSAVESAKDAVYDATIGKAAIFMKNIGNEVSSSSVVRTAKENPLPFILIGAGAGLLAYRSYGNGKRPSASRTLTSAAGARSYRETSETDRDSGQVNGEARTVSGVASKAYDRVTSAVDTAWSGAGDVASQAYSKVGDVGTVAREQYDHYIDENPLAVGAVALALGAAVGMAIPATNYEGRLMGQARQDLMHKAESTASDLLDKTKQVVTDAGKNVTEQARAAISE